MRAGGRQRRRFGPLRRLAAGDIFVRPAGERQAELDEMRFLALLGNALNDYKVRCGPDSRDRCERVWRVMLTSKRALR